MNPLCNDIYIRPLEFRKKLLYCIGIRRKCITEVFYLRKIWFGYESEIFYAILNLLKMKNNIVWNATIEESTEFIKVTSLQWKKR